MADEPLKDTDTSQNPAEAPQHNQALAPADQPTTQTEAPLQEDTPVAPAQEHADPVEPAVATKQEAPAQVSPQSPQPAPAPYEQQTVQQQYFAQPDAAPIQYVVAQQSLKGLRGWLLFFMVVSGFAALSYAGLMVNALANFSVDRLADVIFLPLLFAAAVTSVVLAALEKKTAKYAFIGFYGAAYLYSIVTSAVNGADLATLISGAIGGALWVLFLSLYFMTSKRVKETLVK